MRSGSQGTTIRGRTARWKAGTHQLLAKLSDEQQAALRRATAGSAPGIYSGWLDQPDTGHALDLPWQTIEDTARGLLRAYDWPVAPAPTDWPPSGYIDFLGQGRWQTVGPDWQPDPGRSRLQYDGGSDRVCPKYNTDGHRIEGLPDLRLEALSVIQLLAEARTAIAGRYIESAMLRAMNIGTLYARIAAMLIYGPSIASGAASDLCRADGHKALRESTEERLSERDDEIRRLDNECRLPSKSARARYIKPRLERWAAAYNEGRNPENQTAVPTVDAISRKLSLRR